MIVSIKDKLTQDIFDGTNSKEARKFPSNLHKNAKRKLDSINAAAVLNDLRIPPANRLHALSGDLEGFHSISINDQWRTVFKWTDGQGAREVEIRDYH
jgi:proteic killer suppression protein